MHGNTAGLESADTSGPGDPGTVRGGPVDDEEEILASIEDTVAFLEQKGEFKAAREVGDALARYRSLKALCEGQRSSEAAHGEASSNAQVDAFPA